MTHRIDIEAHPQALAQCLALYQASFPEEERQPIPLLLERIQRGDCQLFAMQEQGEAALMAVVWPLPQLPWAFLEYIAVSPRQQGKGLASRFLENFGSWTGGRSVLAEIEPPTAQAPNLEQRIRRWHFYQRCGFWKWEGIDYRMPNMQGGEALPLWLLCNHPDMEAATPERMRETVRALYAHPYALSGTPVELQHILDSIQNQ